MSFSFENKVALVTGAGSGMGLATAKAFAEAGAAVVLADIHENSVRSTAEELVSAGRKTLAWRNADHGHDAHLHCGTARWQSRRLDGTGQRRRVSSRAIEYDSQDLQLKRRRK